MKLKKKKFSLNFFHQITMNTLSFKNCINFISPKFGTLLLPVKILHKIITNIKVNIFKNKYLLIYFWKVLKYFWHILDIWTKVSRPCVFQLFISNFSFFEIKCLQLKSISSTDLFTYSKILSWMKFFIEALSL